MCASAEGTDAQRPGIKRLDARNHEWLCFAARFWLDSLIIFSSARDKDTKSAGPEWADGPRSIHVHTNTHKYLTDICVYYPWRLEHLFICLFIHMLTYSPTDGLCLLRVKCRKMQHIQIYSCFPLVFERTYGPAPNRWLPSWERILKEVWMSPTDHAYITNSPCISIIILLKKESLMSIQKWIHKILSSNETQHGEKWINKGRRAMLKWLESSCGLKNVSAITRNHDETEINQEQGRHFS